MTQAELGKRGDAVAVATFPGWSAVRMSKSVRSHAMYTLRAAVWKCPQL